MMGQGFCDRLVHKQEVQIESTVYLITLYLDSDDFWKKIYF